MPSGHCQGEAGGSRRAQEAIARGINPQEQMVTMPTGNFDQILSKLEGTQGSAC